MKNGKKTGVVFLSLALAASLLAGCKSNIPPQGGGSPSSTPSAGGSGALKTGFAVLTSIADSKDAGGEDGLAKTDSTVAAVTVDSEGRIADCIIDGVQVAINFTGDGKLTSDTAAQFQSKRELGEAYGLKKASGIGREWNEQAAAFAAYAVGKTIDEVKGIAVREGVPAEADLASSVTIHVGDFIRVIEKAAAGAQALGAQAGDRLSLGIVTDIADSADAGETDGVAQAYSTYTVATFDADGRITSCIIDATQANVSFDRTGRITTDLTAPVPTKDELGDAYGMKKASGIGREWNEQAAAFAAYTVGKTVEEVKGIAVTEKGSPADADLASSVTIGIGDFNAALEKAAASVK